MSNSIDMRWHWVRDRIRQGHFRAVFVPGISNHADFFTKALPVARHKLQAPFSAVDPDYDVTTLYYNKLNILSCLYDVL
jgi:hypothetical protein